MANERLQAAIHEAGFEVEDLADMVGVSAKTVRRWVAGRTPYGRHRTQVAKALGKHERDLWPEQELVTEEEDARSEILAAFAHGDALGVPDWRPMLKAATVQIDLLDYTLAHILTSADVVELLAAKAAAGCRIRLLISSPDSAHLVLAEAEQGIDVTLTDVPASASEVHRIEALLQPLLEAPTVEAREFITGRFNSVLRFDDQMLLSLHTFGTTAVQAPVLHLRRQGDRGLFEQFAAHYEAIWEGASPLLVPADPATP